MSSATRSSAPAAARLLEIAEESSSFRCAYFAPAGVPLGTCVIVQSGQAGAYDEDRSETALYDRLTERLTERGTGTVRFDLPRRADLTRAASPEHVAARTLRLLRVLREPRLGEVLARPVLLGVSLGGRCVLRLISAVPPAVAPSGVVLVGYVVGEVVPITVPLAAIHLVFGAEDHIAFVYEDGSLSEPVAPADYAADASALLVTAEGSTPTVHVLDGLGHTLAPQAAPFLADLIERALRTGAAADPETEVPA